MAALVPTGLCQKYLLQSELTRSQTAWQRCSQAEAKRVKFCEGAPTSSSQSKGLQLSKEEEALFDDDDDDLEDDELDDLEAKLTETKV